MKKIVYIIVSFMFLLPCMVNAETYENTKDIVNKYILNTTYRGTYQKYLLTNTSNYYIDGESEGFDKGGLINYKEFLITQNRKSPMFSYLYDGYNYWTYTKSGNKRYLVSNINDVVVNESDTTPKVRVTEYVKQDAKVEGSGTISDPWIFVPSYEVNITTNEYGSISIRKNNDCTKGSSIKEVDLTYIKGDTLDICIKPNNGYVYVSNNCDNFLTLSSSKEYLTLKNVTKDINCKIYFSKSSNKITLDQTNAEVTSLPTEIYLIYSQGWYKDKEATTQISSLDRVPKRTGYNFNGYTHQKTDGTTLEIINSSGKIITNENTLKAFESAGSLKINWKVKTTNVTLDNQGGTLSKSPITATYDSDMPTITSLPTRTGYKFEGYYYGTNGSGTKYYNSDGTSANKWNIDSENTTLYAYWTPNKFNIVFNANGATIKNEVELDGTKYYWKLNTNGNIMRSKDKNTYTESFYSKNYTSNIDLPNYNYSNYIKLTKTGYIALSGKEWCTNSDGSGECFNQAAIYSAKDICPTIVSGDCDIKLYTNWTANKYTITFNKQSGSGGTGTTTATYNSAMPKITPPTRAGYTFQGYYTGTSGSGTKYYNANGTSANKWNKASNTTLYAYWTANKYTITFNKQSGSGGTGTTTATYNSAMPKITPPTRAGYTFQGYYTGTSGSGTKYYNANGTSANKWNKASNTTLYAYWKLDRIACADLNNVIQCNTTDTSKIINYTGNCSYVCENISLNNFKIKFLTSGTLTLNMPLNVDLFLVGGGGASGTSVGRTFGWGGGGGGGYTKTYKNQTLNSTSYYINVGAGGQASSSCSKSSALFSPGVPKCKAGVAKSGKTTYIRLNGQTTNIYEAKGGYGGSCSDSGTYFGSGHGTCITDQDDTIYGGKGGSGGGPGWTNMYCQGMYPGSNKGKNGQGYSTCEFATESDAAGTCPSGIEYSRGGDGSCQYDYDPNRYGNNGADGKANTGNGASGFGAHSGGSGIVIIRNKR